MQPCQTKTNEIEDDAMKYALSTLAGAAALAISLIAGPAMAEDAGIIVYNAQHESLTKEWAEGFTKETGIKVTLRNGGDSDFSNQIVAEGAASPADVFLTENSPAMVLVESGGPVRAGRRRHAGAGAAGLPAGQRQMGRRRRAQHRLCLQQDQAHRRPAAQVDARSRRSELEGPLGRLALRAPISRPSSARCCSSRAKPPRPTG